MHVHHDTRVDYMGNYVDNPALSLKVITIKIVVLRIMMFAENSLSKTIFYNLLVFL